uniref:Calcium-transporting ATPase n=1 Tax=Rhizophora mucronata TaxID=61149 RepID=A0A2P2M3J8_RHIMU
MEDAYARSVAEVIINVLGHLARIDDIL